MSTLVQEIIKSANKENKDDKNQNLSSDSEKDDIFVTTSTGTVFQLNVTYQPHFR